MSKIYHPSDCHYTVQGSRRKYKKVESALKAARKVGAPRIRRVCLDKDGLAITPINLKGATGTCVRLSGGRKKRCVKRAKR